MDNSVARGLDGLIGCNMFAWRFFLLGLMFGQHECVAFQPLRLSERASFVALRAASFGADDNDTSNPIHDERPSPSRFHLFLQCISLLAGGIPASAVAFDGGVGGLGKTKPETGLVFWGDSIPLQNEKGIISAEINVSGDPVLVEFTTPWPLLPTTSGLEARNLQSLESAYCCVLPNAPNDKQLKKVVLDNILGSQGKYGAYGTPTDVKFKRIEDDLYLINFTALTPAMRESERSVFLKVLQPIQGKDMVVLVTGTTRARFKSQETVLRKVADSFVAIAAPKSQRNLKQESQTL